MFIGSRGQWPRGRQYQYKGGRHLGGIVPPPQPPPQARGNSAEAEHCICWQLDYILPWYGLIRGSGQWRVVVPTARPPKKLFFGNRQPHLPNVERNRPPQDTFLLSQESYRPPGSNPPRNTEVTCSAHLQTYGSVFFVLCSLYFIVFCIVIVRFRRFSLY